MLFCDLRKHIQESLCTWEEREPKIDLFATTMQVAPDDQHKDPCVFVCVCEKAFSFHDTALPGKTIPIKCLRWPSLRTRHDQASQTQPRGGPGSPETLPHGFTDELWPTSSEVKEQNVGTQCGHSLKGRKIMWGST